MLFSTLALQFFSAYFLGGVPLVVCLRHGTRSSCTPRPGDLFQAKMVVPQHGREVDAPSCSHPSCWSFVADTHESCTGQSLIPRRLRTTRILDFTGRLLPLARAGSCVFGGVSPFLSLPPASLVSSVCRAEMCQRRGWQLLPRITGMIVEKRTLPCGYGKDCASAFRGHGARMLFAECDPFCALQAYFEGVKASSSLFTQRPTSTSSLWTT